jgi:hypothetical protein
MAGRNQGEILEEGKGTDKVQNLWGGISQMK